MKKRLATQAEAFNIYNFMEDNIPYELPDFEEFKNTNMISICEISTDLKIANVTEVYTCSNPQCGCNIIMPPLIVVIVKGTVKFADFNEGEGKFFILPNGESQINSKPHLN